MGATANDMHDLVEKLEVMKQRVAQTDQVFFDAYGQFSQQAKKDGALSNKMKELICVASGVLLRCSYCIAVHVKKAIDAGATRQEIMETAFVAVNMGGGPSLAYTTEVIDACDEFGAK